MPKYIYLQLYATQGGAVPPTIKVRADKVEKDTQGKVTIKIGNDIVGEFYSVQGWWSQDEANF